MRLITKAQRKDRKMNQDTNIVREILLIAEEFSVYGKSCHFWKIRHLLKEKGLDVDLETLWIQCNLMKSGGLINFASSPDACHFKKFVAVEIKDKGKEFLDSIRHPMIWEQTKEKLSTELNILPFDVIQDIAIGVANRMADDAERKSIGF